MQECLRIGFIILVGTTVYLAIIVAAGVLPPAAGLMLTFPALNGLGFFFSHDTSAAPLAKTMLWLPVINGLLCAAYILLFILLGQNISPTPTGWCLLACIVGMWSLCVTRGRVKRGIEREYQLTYCTIVTLAGAVCVMATVWLLSSSSTTGNSPLASPSRAIVDWIIEPIARSELKIVLFVLALTVFAMITTLLPISDSTRGILAGLPVVPFGGLVAIADDPAMVAEERFQNFWGMLSSVWLGPAIAVWLIYGLSSFYALRKNISERWLNTAARLCVLIGGWALCFVVITAIGYTINL